MKRLTLNILLSFATLPLLASSTAFAGGPAANGSGDNSEKMKTLFQCGVGTESGFNGWKLEGLSNETITYFESDHIEFFQHRPGNYSVGFEKRMDEIVGYTDIRLAADIEAIENCAINSATAYLSTDGRHWKAINRDVRRGADIHNEKMDFSFIKIIADVTFFKEGRFRMNSASVFGKYTPKKQEPATDLSAIVLGPAICQIYQVFNVFSFQKKVNIETQNEEVYDFELRNLLGQIILTEKSQGSRRFETDVPDGIYIVTIIQDDKLVTTKKVVL